jgi:hypothetical protein
MKRTILSTLFLLLPLLSVYSENTSSPVATLTEVVGKVEIKKGQNWEQLYPLQPLNPGDVIRISAGGKAVLMYLGASTEILTESQSPYFIKEKQYEKNRKKKVSEKINVIVQSLMNKKEERSMTLATRSYSIQPKKLEGAQPDMISLLYQEDFISLRWQGEPAQYHVNVYVGNKYGGGKSIYENEVNENKISIPINFFPENTDCYWTVFSATHQGGGEFHILSKTETRSILSEISKILREISEENSITHYLIKYGFFLNKGLYYDADKILLEARTKYPENETFRKLAGEDK